MEDKSINDKKQIGDYATVAKMLGTTTESVRMAWSRKKGNAYENVKKALIKVIESRELLLSNKNS